MKPKGLFITGTDTGVGKTHCVCLIASRLKTMNMRVGVMKPAESDCREDGGRLIPEDALKIKEASGCNLPLDLICPYALPKPLAPAEAARQAGVVIDTERIKKDFREIAQRSEMVLVEGAGGLLVPLSGNYLFADLSRELELPVLIIARAGLGTVNHCLLTIEAAKARNLNVLAVLLNESSSQRDASFESNPRILKKLTSTPILGPLPYSSDEHTLNDQNGSAQHAIDEICRMVLSGR